MVIEPCFSLGARVYVIKTIECDAQPTVTYVESFVIRQKHSQLG